jgi:protein-S-isoprenylcysteine O-methyltransferase Ste14
VNRWPCDGISIMHTYIAFALGLLCVGSWLSLVPVAAGVALHVLRTALEDRTLLAELPGYRDYAVRVRYRLVPGIR